MLELALTRVLSVLVWYHFAFLIVGIALLGFGVSGTLLAALPGLSRIPREHLLAGCGVGFGVSAVVGLLVVGCIPFRPFGILADGTQVFYLAIAFILLSLPFIFAGAAVGTLLLRRPEVAGGIYGADLAGAGLGCLGFSPAIATLGGAGSVLLAALLGYAAAGCFSRGPSVFRRWTLAGILSVGGLSGAWLALPATNRSPLAGIHSAKWVFQLDPEHILWAEWNAFSRIDVLAPPSPEGPMPVVIDGGAATAYIPRIGAGLEAEDGDRVRDGLPLIHQMKIVPDVLVVGAGGGIDVRDFLANGARSVTAVEINPILNRLVVRQYADFAGHLYADPRVHWVTEDARSFLRRSARSYDIIYAGLTITNAASASGALGLTENHTLTLEAMQEALEHLTEGGILYLLRSELDILRLVITAREVLRQSGASEPRASIAVLRHPPRGGRYSQRAALMVRRGPFTDAERLLIDRYAQEYGWEVRYGPGMSGDTPFHRALGMGAAEPLPGVPLLLEPATDDRPFFNHFFPWGVLACPGLWGSLQARYGIEETSAAEAVVAGVLGVSVALGAGLLLLPLWVSHGPAALKAPRTAARFVYFLALGLGFLFLEIGFIERFSLLLGQPAYSLAAVLGGLLIFSGLGSLLSLRSDRRPEWAWPALLLGIVAAILLETHLLPRVFRAILEWSLAGRVAAVVGLLAPLGLLLGTAFPLGVRRAGQEAPGQVPWLWGANGFASVTGSALGMMVAMTFGLTALLNMAAGVYGVALLSAVWQTRGGNREGVRG
ncbi:MAG: class I SAM-dependent methyltransferase [Candidatus Latescibacteria bacterium]|nr:class I SAM-dependent methyltransferase [Candidatus Latescibacterota bacterium]